MRRSERRYWSQRYQSYLFCGATGRSATSSTSSVGQLAAALPVPLRLWRYGSQRDPLWCSSCDGVNIITLRHHHRGNRPSIRSPTSLPTREAKKLAENNRDTLRPKSDDCPKFSGILSDIPRNPQRWSGRSTSEILPCRCHELCRRIWELSRFTLATTGVVARRWIVNQQNNYKQPAHDIILIHLGLAIRAC